jgi:uncharacterized protein YqhQ
MRIRNGKSYFAGFMVEAEHKGVKRAFFTKNFSEEEYTESPYGNMPDTTVIIRVFMAAFAALVVIGYFLHFYLDSSMGFLTIFSIVFCSFLSAFVLSPLWIIAAYGCAGSGWHACEHKIVHVLQKGRPINIDAFKWTGRYHRGCGTNIMIGIGSFCLFILFYPLIRMSPIGSSIILTFCAYYLSYRIVSCLVQIFITTAEPDIGQYEETVRLAEEIREWQLLLDKSTEPNPANA